MYGKPTKNMYPTPTQDSASERTKKYSQGGMPLPMAVKMFPTPTAGCVEGGEQSSRVEMTEKGGFILRKKNKPENTFGAKLSDAMLYLEKMYPTPMARDHKDINFNTTWKLGNKSQNTMARQVLKHNKPGGKLNPNFVEFLMGYPTNWTKIDPTE
jgi:DNA (cytosine-5)-methyltransferase 1